MYEGSGEIMKIPFYTVVGPLLRRNKHHINTFCTHPVLAFAPFYVGVLGLLGVVLSAFDIWRIIKCGPVLPGYLWRERMKKGKIITPEAERDLGLFTNNPVFYMPFLALYALIISLEFLVFITRAFVDGLELQKWALVMTIFMMYNWSAVACTFARSMSCCDL